MEKLIKLLLAILILSGHSLIVSAQTSTADIPYQGVARNADGSIVANRTISLRFSLLEGSPATGTLVHQETQSATTNSLGLFVTKCISSTTGAFNPLVWTKLAASGAFLKVEMDVNGGSAFVDMGTTQLLSVPFALFAASSNAVEITGEWDATTNTPPLSSSVGQKGYCFRVKVSDDNPVNNTMLDGINDWGVNDWAVFDGVHWQKVDNSEKPLSSLGAVVYAGTWDAQTNTPPLTTAVGTKGDYYVVSVAGNHTLNNTSEWNVGDWAIYNGSAWEKVDNTGSVTDGENTGTPGAHIFKTKSGTLLQFKTITNTDGSVAVADDLNSIDIGIEFDDAGTSDSRAWSAHKISQELNTKIDRSGGVMTGNLVLNADPSEALGAATKQYVDAADATLQTQINGKLNLSGGTMTGDLVLNANPSTVLGAATKQYVDAADASKANTVSGTANNFAKLNGSGQLVDSDLSADDFLTKTNTTSYTPVSDYNPATKKYVDQAIITHPGSVNFKGTWNAQTNSPNLSSGVGNEGDLYIISNASPDPSQNTTLDGNNKYVVGDAVIYNQSIYQRLHTSSVPDPATDISFSSTTTISATNVQGAIEELQSDFGDVIDSYIHQEDDNVYIYSPPGSTGNSDKRFGIGDNAPASPLGIKTEGTEKRALTITPSTLTPGSTYTFTLSALSHPGFNLQEEGGSTGNSSRFFVQESTGFVGIGTTTPSEKLHIQQPVLNGGAGIAIQNSATTHNRQWLIEHFQNGDIPTQDDFLAISENQTGTTTNTTAKRLVIMPGGNVGINETLPYATLHVTKPVNDPSAAIDLIAGTGIVVVGPITDNIVFDYRGIQARQGTYVDPLNPSALAITASELKLQPYGGGLTINNSMAPANRVIIDNNGNIGIGKTATEKLEVNGAVVFGDTNTAMPAEGTVRWHVATSDLEVFRNGQWNSLTTHTNTDDFVSVGSTGNMITYNPAGAKVGIGLATPSAMLHVRETNTEATASTAMIIHSTSSTLSLADVSRVGLEIKNNGQWGSNSYAKNIGLYVSDVSGTSTSQSSMAAVLNGNVVIGAVTTDADMVGDVGNRVLSIQNGTAPTSATSGIQIYSSEIGGGPGSPPVSIFHLLNGDGTTIKLFRGDALPPSNSSTISSTTYGPTESAVIKNMRDRIDALELRLQALGLIL